MAFFCFGHLTQEPHFVKKIYAVFFVMENLFPIGRLQKTFGAHGELLLAPYSASLAPSRKAPVFISVDGLNVPFYIKSIAAKNDRFVVIFDDMEQEALAQALVGKEVLVEKTEARKATASFAESEMQIGYTFEDVTLGAIGKLVRRLDYPGNPVLQLVTEQGREVLIPDNPRFVVSVDKKRRIVRVSLPEGLLEVYLT
jgi:16S rRNA processing protein RimM